MAKPSVILIFAMLVIADGMDINLDKEWKMYKSFYCKHYTEKEEPMRKSIWESNVLFVFQHNIQADLGIHTYTTGINFYSDMGIQEFISKVTGFRPHNETRGSRTQKVSRLPSDIQVNDTVDWRTLGYVTQIKNQGQCGSCWAFCTVGALEAMNKRKTGKLVSLSEQNLVDCATNEGNSGCGGGLTVFALDYVIKNNGIDTEESYPYVGTNGKCRFSRSSVGATCTGYGEIAELAEYEMKIIVSSIGPITVGIDAGTTNFQLYRSGVFEGSSCSKAVLNHCVLIIGYGTEEDGDYWLGKNSWGDSWGSHGYFKIARNTNECGIATGPSVYPK